MVGEKVGKVDSTSTGSLAVGDGWSEGQINRWSIAKASASAQSWVKRWVQVMEEGGASSRGTITSGLLPHTALGSHLLEQQATLGSVSPRVWLPRWGLLLVLEEGALASCLGDDEVWWRRGAAVKARLVLKKHKLVCAYSLLIVGVEFCKKKKRCSFKFVVQIDFISNR